MEGREIIFFSNHHSIHGRSTAIMSSTSQGVSYECMYYRDSLCNTTCIHIPCVNSSSINWNPQIPVYKHYLTEKYALTTTLPISMYQLSPYRKCVQTITLPASVYQLSPSRQACINYQYYLTLPLYMFMAFLRTPLEFFFF